MVWFQCEDCGEDLKKPKLPSHFRSCSAYKLSCIDCGQTFTRDTVQSHTQCISEADKYGPKGQTKPSQNAQAKPKPNADVDINVGLSTHPPWFCSLCNTTTTSKQTLLQHADGKKHRAKAKAFHASQNQPNVVEATDAKSTTSGGLAAESLKEGGVTDFDESKEANEAKKTDIVSTGEKDTATKRKTINSESHEDHEKGTKRRKPDLNNGEVIQSENGGPEYQPQAKKDTDVPSSHDHHDARNASSIKEVKDKIKWKKIITSALKSNSGGPMKIKKLQKLVSKALQESGITENKDKVRVIVTEKIASSSRFSVEGKHVSLVV